MTELQQKLQAIRRRELETGTLTYGHPLRYEGVWLIYHNDIGWPSGADFAFQHESYDGPGDNRLGTGSTIHDCILQINEKILEETEETPPAGSIEGVS